MALSLAVLHPFYFGDELFSFAFGAQHGKNFAAVFADLNAYKPRVVMNLLWAMIVAFDLPRWVAMACNAIALAVSAGLVYSLSLRRFAAPRLAALLGASLVLVSRFDVMLLYDYVSGTVETISLASFLAGIALAAPLLFDDDELSPRRWIAAIGCFVIATLTHERYLAAIGGVMALFVLVQVVVRLRSGSWRVGRGGLGFALVATLLPAVLYVALVKLLSQNSLTMGTSGQEIQLGAGTVRVAATYVSNVFLGTNYGPAWFVGRLNQDHPSATVVFAICAAACGLAWALPWAARRWLGPARSVAADRGSLLFLAAACGLILVASLPGAARQEARWMFPVLACVVLLVQSAYRGLFRYLLLAVLAAVQLYYLGWGATEQIASINASQMAERLGNFARNVDPPGAAGLVLASPEPDTSWVLGGNGDVFCRVNLSPGACLYNRSGFDAGLATGYGYALIPSGDPSGPAYRLLPKVQADGMISPAGLPAGGDFLARPGQWDGWNIVDAAKAQADGLHLVGLSENFVRADVGALDGAFIVYRARAVRGDQVPMRLQVNWHDARGTFIAAFVNVVAVTRADADYPALLFAPQGAAYGYVYATLHDGAQGEVVLESVRLVRD